MRKLCCYFLLALVTIPHFLMAQNVGIGTTNPVARLHVIDSAVVFSATGMVPEDAGKTAIEGQGRRMMWHPGKAAFRAGYVTGNAWDDINIGRFSFGAGKDVVAQTTGSIAIGLDNRVEGYGGMAIGSDCFSGYNYGIAFGTNARSEAGNAVAIGNAVRVNSLNGFAIGNGATATANNGFAIGNTVNASGAYSTAMGNNSVASGQYSVAIGVNLTASGQDAVVFGRNSQAIGNWSTSFGLNNIASGDNSTALGQGTLASNFYTTALGRATTASGFAATAFGNGSIASGGNSTVLGYFNIASGTNAFSTGTNSTASGAYSTAIGRGCIASGTYSTALGNFVSTSGFTGALALGDNSTVTVMESFVANGFRARFAGGYRLFTNSAVTIGAFLNANANSWAALSDVRMKENFLPVDGEKFLQKIAAMPLTTWNYIGQDVGTLRHYGPMAQDFYKAFGRDDLGEIGCDTLINQQDFLGVSFIAIQALEKRSTELATENSLLKSKLQLLEEAHKNLAGKLVLLSENMDATLKLVKEQTGKKQVD